MSLEGAASFGCGVAVQDDGAIVAAGSGYDLSGKSDFVAVRLTPEGALDHSCGSDGIVMADFSGAGASEDSADDAAVSGTGAGRRIVVVGSDDHTTTDIDAGTDVAYAVAVQKDARIVVAGSAMVGAGSADVAVVRYTVAGVVDPSFCGDGVVTADVTGESGEAFFALAYGAGSETRVVVVARVMALAYRTEFAPLMYDNSGRLDSAIDSDGVVTTSVGAGATDDRLHEVARRCSSSHTHSFRYRAT